MAIYSFKRDLFKLRLRKQIEIIKYYKTPYSYLTVICTRLSLAVITARCTVMEGIKLSYVP